MIRRRFPFSLLLFLSLQLVLALTPNNTHTHILQDVLKEIAGRQNWDLEGVNISKLEVGKVRYGSSQRHELRTRFGKNYLVFKFPDEQIESWNKFNIGNYGFLDLVKGLGSSAVLGTIKLEGPFDLHANDHHQLSLLLPMNTSHGGLRRILVGDGITVEVTGAQELSHTSNFNFGANASLINKRESGFLRFWQSLCMPLPPIHIVGSASLFAYRTRSANANIATTRLSEDTIELLLEKCYSIDLQKIHARPIHSFDSSIARLDGFLRGFFGDRTRQNGLSGYLRASVKSSNMVLFQLELEKRTGSNETLQGVVLAEWRTRPTIERLWFEVMARVEAEKLKPIMVKKVRPFIAVDSASWSNLMSNISFTKFPSVLVHPEALTLDVKW